MSSRSGQNRASVGKSFPPGLADRERGRQAEAVIGNPVLGSRGSSAPRPLCAEPWSRLLLLRTKRRQSLRTVPAPPGTAAHLDVSTDGWMCSLCFCPGLRGRLPGSCGMSSAPRESSMRRTQGSVPEASWGSAEKVSRAATPMGPAAFAARQKNPEDLASPQDRALPEGLALPSVRVLTLPLHLPRRALWGCRPSRHALEAGAPRRG